MLKKLLLFLLLFIPLWTFGYNSDNFSAVSTLAPVGSWNDFYFTWTWINQRLFVWWIPTFNSWTYFYATEIKLSWTWIMDIYEGVPLPAFSFRIASWNSVSDIIFRDSIKINVISSLPNSRIYIKWFFMNKGAVVDKNYNVYSTSSGSTSLVEFSWNWISVNKDFYYAVFNILLIVFFVFLFSWKVILFVIKKM